MSRPMRSDSLDQLAPALIKAQGEMEELPGDKKVEVKNKEGRFLYDYSYTTLAAIQNIAGPALLKNDLVVTQWMVPYEGPAPPPGVQCLGAWRTELLHASGQFIAGEHPIVGDWSDPGAIGGATTAASRYNLRGVCGLAEPSEAPPEPARRSAPRGNGQAPPTRSNGQPPQSPPQRQAPQPSNHEDVPFDEIGEQERKAAAKDFVQLGVAERFKPGPPPAAGSAPRTGGGGRQDVIPPEGPYCPYPRFPVNSGGFWGWIKDNGLTQWFEALGRAHDLPPKMNDYDDVQRSWAAESYNYERENPGTIKTAAKANGRAS
jgi:hypothetical protein